MNTLKTTLLLAALTALFMVVGSYLGGTEGMWIAFAFALLMNMWSYWFSDRMVLRMYHARPIEEQEAPALYRMVQELSSRAGIAMPKVAMIDLPTPNAFATGRNDRHAVVAVSQSIMQLLNENELRAVLAHEIGHIKNRDMLVATIAASLAGAISMVAHSLMYFGGGSSRDRNGGNVIGLVLTMILTPVMAAIIQSAVSRSRELGADDRGAEYADPVDLANALRKLEGMAKANPLVGEAKYESTAHLFIINPFRMSFMMRLFSTHPPIEERIARLEGRGQGTGNRR